MTLLQFCKKLSVQLIENEYWKEERKVRDGNYKEEERRSKRTKVVEHTLLTALQHASLYTGKKWTCNAVTKYPQYICKRPGCKKKDQNLLCLYHRKLEMQKLLWRTLEIFCNGIICQTLNSVFHYL